MHDWRYEQGDLWNWMLKGRLGLHLALTLDQGFKDCSRLAHRA
jgi:hypothetical protein